MQYPIRFVCHNPTGQLDFKLPSGKAISFRGNCEWKTSTADQVIHIETKCGCTYDLTFTDWPVEQDVGQQAQTKYNAELGLYKNGKPVTDIYRWIYTIASNMIDAHVVQDVAMTYLYKGLIVRITGRMPDLSTPSFDELKYIMTTSNASWLV